MSYILISSRGGGKTGQDGSDYDIRNALYTQKMQIFLRLVNNPAAPIFAPLQL